MDDIIEFILELIFECGIEVCKNSKIPKYIRYPLIVIISLSFIAIIGIILFVIFSILKSNLIAGIILLVIVLVMLVLFIFKYGRTFLVKINKK